MSNIDRAELMILGRTATAAARALADAGLLRPDPEAGDEPHIEAYLSTHRPDPEGKAVHRAELHIDIGGQHGYHNLNAYVTAEWCREAAAILLDVAHEVDRKNKETAEEEADVEAREKTL